MRLLGLAQFSFVIAACALAIEELIDGLAQDLGEPRALRIDGVQPFDNSVKLEVGTGPGKFRFPR
jgi:hypothetical protein